MDPMPSYDYVILALGWLLWFLPFPITKWNRNTPQRSDSRARWGLLIQAIAYMLLWQGRFWEQNPPNWRLALSVIFLVLAAVLSWTSTRALGRHLRFDAALSSDHELVQSGPYRIIRHPIYSSMFCILLGTGFMITPLVLFVPAVVIFLIGTEIRVRVEDNLLASHFGAKFETYQRAVSAYIPLVR
jgi:protein-S-isoprenylcysteine O-methyltransferase Ste14